ncbi:metal ABC transporter permease [Vallitalea okinawensis]|uniref:metal ABC transporter permease n=1 Tax=Vallitalea okinawensis TaxID=2078660 RepID=UPI001FA867E0|nr:metal ABC transporter permease [Vallitalea okinawensis]
MFQYTFIQNAFVAAILTSIICGIIGTIIVEKKLVMMSGGIAHASFGGIGLGFLLGIEPIMGGLLFAILSALGVVKIKDVIGTKADTLIAMFWSVGMALGILFIALTPGYPPDMTSYLFGDILAVSTSDIYITAFLTVIIIFVIASLFVYWQAYLFDEEYLKVKGFNVKTFEYILYVLISIAIIIVVKVVGIVLIIALLTIPTSIAKMYSRNLRNLMFLSILISIIICVAGLYISYYIEIPSGATIILTGSLLYILHYFVK